MLTLGDDDVVLMAIGGGLVIALIGMLTSFFRSIYKTRAVEQTKREIAAYIAEGSMKPEDGERIIKADMPHWEKS